MNGSANPPKGNNRHASAMSSAVLRGLLDTIKGIESPDWTDKVGDGALTILHPEIVHDMLDQIQAKELSAAGVSGERLAIMDSDRMQDILKRVKEGEGGSGSADEAVWSRRMLARPYARALFEAALKGKQLDRAESDLQKVADVCLSEETMPYLEDPEVRFEDRSRLLTEETRDLHQAVMDLVYRLMDQQQLRLLPDILDEYRHLRMGRNAVIRAEIITAIPLDEEDLQRIGGRLSRLVGKKIFLEPRVDPEIIGGFIIKLGSTKMDASIRSRLTAMRGKMASKDLHLSKSSGGVKRWRRPGNGSSL